MKVKGLLALAIGLLATYSALMIYAFQNYPSIMRVWTGKTIYMGWTTALEQITIHLPDIPVWIKFLQSEVSIFILIGLSVFTAIVAHKVYSKRRIA